jgi:hypothetical protein
VSVSFRRWKRSGEGANGRKERVPEGLSAYNSGDELGLGYTIVGRDWSSWAALWGGIVH